MRRTKNRPERRLAVCSSGFAYAVKTAIPKFFSHLRHLRMWFVTSGSVERVGREDARDRFMGDGSRRGD